MHRIKRMSTPVSKKKHTSLAFLRLLHHQFDLNQPRKQRRCGSVVLAYFCLLRYFDFLQIGAQRHPYCLKMENAFF